MIVHEYGQAVRASRVDGSGASLDAASIGEAFGDYLGATIGLDAADQFGWTVAANPACGLTVGDHEDEVHVDGQIWAQALWEIRLGYDAMGRTTRAWDTTLIDAQFDLPADTSFSAAAQATDDTALARDGRAAATLVKQRSAVRGITF